MPMLTTQIYSVILVCNIGTGMLLLECVLVILLLFEKNLDSP